MQKKIIILILLITLSLNMNATQLNQPTPSTIGGVITLNPYCTSTHNGVTTTHLTQYGKNLLKQQQLNEVK